MHYCEQSDRNVNLDILSNCFSLGKKMCHEVRQHSIAEMFLYIGNFLFLFESCSNILAWELSRIFETKVFKLMRKQGLTWQIANTHGPEFQTHLGIFHFISLASIFISHQTTTCTHTLILLNSYCFEFVNTNLSHRI